MRLNITDVMEPTIDILIAVAERGGVENCINMLGRYLLMKRCRIRIVQLVYEGTAWADENLEFYHIYSDRNGQTLQTFIGGYGDFLEKNGTPDIVLATCWPMMCQVAKSASERIGKDFMVASWLHAPIQRYKIAGYGGSEYLEKADLHFAISEEIAKEIKRLLPADTIYRVNNPIDAKKTCICGHVKAGKIAFVGRLSGEKNLPVLLRAIASTNTEWKLKLIGDGEEKNNLQKLASELGIESKIEFAGWQQNPWVCCSDCYGIVMSSLYEGSPLVAIEALSCGMPVIANVSSGMNAMIKPGVNGFLYPDSDYESLAKILDMISLGAFQDINPEECKKTVGEYGENIALFDYYLKIFTTCNGRVITDSVYNETACKSILNEKISVIIPCYNAEQYIRRCLDSILRQSIGLEHLKIIAVDDGSIDNTMSVLLEYDEKFPESFCIVELGKNEGQGHARNIGIEYVDTEYITFVDADDCLDEMMLETLYLAHLCYPANVVDCEFEMFSDGVPESDRAGNYKRTVDIVEDDSDAKRIFLENAFINSPCTRLFLSSMIIPDKDLRFPEHTFMEDIYFFYMILAKARSWYHIDYKGYYYYQNPDSTMHSSRLNKYYMDVFNVFSKAVEKYKVLNIFDKYEEELAFVYFKKVFEQLCSYMENSLPTYPEENYRIIFEYLLDTFPGLTENRYLSENDKTYLEERIKKASADGKG